MLDIQFIRHHAQEIQRAADLKGLKVSIAELLDADQKRRAALQLVEDLRAKRNQFTQEMGQLAAAGQAQTSTAENIKNQVRGINTQLKDKEAELQVLEQQYIGLMYKVPNIISPDTPEGESDQDNVEIKKVGEIPQFSFLFQDHIEIGTRLDLFDIPRGVKVAGSRNYFIKGMGFHLQRAVLQLAIDVLVKKSFTLMDVPVTANEDALYRTGFFPGGEEQTYHIEKDRKYLVGTSEVPLVSYFSGEIVDAAEPIRLAALSNSFRREAGSAGRDVHGLYRVHQFTKVEQVILCQADLDLSNQLLEEITQNAEEILQLLELPYRVVAVCTGDMSQKNYKQYDIETWMPSRQAYGETHSSSNVLEFQARRSNLRYRNEQGELKFCYTLNNTAIASPRILIPLLENHQQEDGSIYIPKALRPYMYGLDRIDQGTVINIK